MGRPQDRIGVLAFGSKHQVAQPLTDFENFNPKGAVKQTTKLDKYTNLAAGLENAYYLLKTEGREAARRADRYLMGEKSLLEARDESLWELA